MQTGTVDMLFLLFIFLGLQAFWIIPIIKRKNNLIHREGNIKEEIIKLEKIYKKY